MFSMGQMLNFCWICLI